jgi:hypothetical protein
MRKEKQYVDEVEIIQTENGFIAVVGSACSGSRRERYVFQSFTELVNFLNEHFTHRDENIYNDFINQTSIILKNK